MLISACTGKIGSEVQYILAQGLKQTMYHVCMYQFWHVHHSIGFDASSVRVAGQSWQSAKHKYDLQVEPALPSERYLKILQKGAKQHNLSGEYQVYLQALQHYQPSSRGQLAGRWIVLNTFGRALKFFMMRIMPKVKNPFACWLTHEVLANYILVMWWLHDYIMEPALGSGRHH